MPVTQYTSVSFFVNRRKTPGEIAGGLDYFRKPYQEIPSIRQPLAFRNSHSSKESV